MHNLTPLGISMHLKELERQATPRFHPLRTVRRDNSPVTGIRAAMTTLLRRLHAVGIPRRVARQGKSYS
jgi:hypothetical protein